MVAVCVCMCVHNTVCGSPIGPVRRETRQRKRNGAKIREINTRLQGRGRGGIWMLSRGLNKMVILRWGDGWKNERGWIEDF